MDPEIRLKCLELAQLNASGSATTEEVIKAAAAYEQYCAEGAEPSKEPA